MKKLIASILFFGAILTANAQTPWTFSSGFGVLIGPSKTVNVNQIKSFPVAPDTNVIQYRKSAFGANLFMYPKYHFVEKPSSSKSKYKRSKKEDEKPFDFSIGAPFMLGLGFGGGFGGGGTSFMYSLSINGDINLGGCKANSDQVAGGYIGVGLGIANTSNISVSPPTYLDASYYKLSYSTIEDYYSPDYKISALGFGPNIHGGFEFGASTNRKFGAMVAYQPAINKDGINYITIGLQIPLGNGMYF